MARIEVLDRDGVVHRLQTPAGTVLMRLLRDEGLGVAGTCGGMSSCGSCHIYVRGGPPLPPPAEDEADMLAALADVVAVTPASRLSCQIELAEDGVDLVVEVAPQL